MYSSVAASHGIFHVDFSHVRIQSNKPAHLLAKHSLGVTNFSIWIEENLCFIEQALNHDVLVAFHSYLKFLQSSHIKKMLKVGLCTSG